MLNFSYDSPYFFKKILKYIVWHHSLDSSYGISTRDYSINKSTEFSAVSIFKTNPLERVAVKMESVIYYVKLQRLCNIFFNFDKNIFL